VGGPSRPVQLGHQGALTHLLDPTPLLGVARLEALGEEEVIGRRAIRLRAVPRNQKEVIEPGWYVLTKGWSWRSSASAESPCGPAISP
jgi:hypothetical protein